MVSTQPLSTSNTGDEVILAATNGTTHLHVSQQNQRVIKIHS